LLLLLHYYYFYFGGAKISERKIVWQYTILRPDVINKTIMQQNRKSVETNTKMLEHP